jgi:hypothetical protein
VNQDPDTRDFDRHPDDARKTQLGKDWSPQQMIFIRVLFCKLGTFLNSHFQQLKVEAEGMGALWRMILEPFPELRYGLGLAWSCNWRC